MKRSKLLALALALTMGLSLVPAALAAETETEQFPARFDLRDYGVITPVKSQNPLQTCWSFGGIAAAEGSILTTLGLTYDQYREKYGEDFDLSEKHLAWYATHPVTEQINEAQAGEGLIYPKEAANPMAVYDGGGKPIYITTLFSSGVGPVFEKKFPYQGATGLTIKEVFDGNHNELARKSIRRDLEASVGVTLEELVEAFQQDPTLPMQLFSGAYAEGYFDESIPGDQLTVDQILDAYVRRTTATVQAGEGNEYSAVDDWTIPELGEDGYPNRNRYAGFTLVDGNRLPELTVKDDEGHWIGVNEEGIRAVKSELMQGRPVSIAYKADQSKPGDVLSPDSYMNVDTWAQYTHEDKNISHAVCIVGWDDNYSRDNFNANHKPPMDGAWIVKNSWGSETDYKTLADGNKINLNNWGIKNEAGEHTGFFYLSYCDKTVTNAESMVFDTDLDSDDGMAVWMYDYMPSILDSLTITKSENVLKTANIFPNDSGVDVALRAVSTKTATPDAQVTYSVYLLNEGAQNPEDGQLLGRYAAEYRYAGFHRQSLRGDIILRDGQTLAVVAEETVTGENGEKLYEYAVNTALNEKFAQDYGWDSYASAVVNSGESFLYQDGQWLDWADYEIPLTDTLVHEFAKEGLELTNTDYFAVDNFSIKIYLLAAGEETAYNDVTDADWFAPAVSYVSRIGLMNGVGDNMFAPNAPVTGEQAMAVLARFCGKDAATLDEAVEWAAETNIADPALRKLEITREQFAVMLYHVAQLEGGSAPQQQPESFDDWYSVSARAQDAMSWAVAAGVINGVGDHRLAPQGGITRSQMAAMFMRYASIQSN